MRRNGRQILGSIITTLALLILVPAVTAQTPPGEQPPVYAPAAISAPSISIMDAVRLTLLNDPSVKLAEQSTLQQRGYAQEQTGTFDTDILGSIDFNYEQTELGKDAIKAETDRRKQQREVANQTHDRAEQVQAELDAVRNANPNDFNLGLDDPDAQAFQTQVELFNALLRAAGEAERQKLLELRDQMIQTHITELQNTLDVLHKEEADALERLRKFGTIPRIQENYFGTLSLTLVQPLRTGMVVSPFFTFSGNGTYYKGKKQSQDWGGLGLEDLYKSQLGFTVTLPLGRGSGVESVAAAERAAWIDYDASNRFERHIAASSVYSATLAYWNLVAAQEQLEVARESEKLQNQLVGLTQDLIEGDEIPRAELSRAQAEESNSLAIVSSSQQSLYQARVQLAQSMGLRVEDETNAPLASSPFPTPPPMDVVLRLDASRLGDMAVARREDLRATEMALDSGKLLLNAARLDLRPKFDLTGKLYYSGVRETGSFGRGFAGTVSQWTGPSTSLAASFERPIGNNLWKGRYAQQQALYNQKDISSTNLRRLIKADVVATVASLKEAATQLDQSERAVGYYHQSVDSELEKLRLGTSTLVNVVFTEQQLISAMVGLVDARYTYASLLTRLRYDTGTIVDTTGDVNRVFEENFYQLPPLAGGSR
ncbi:MAG: TolC family protein [Thermoanaerobaculia bacterium]